MSELFRDGANRFFLNSNENQEFNNNELPHVHCSRVGSGEIKIMLNTGDIKVVRLGIGQYDFKAIREIVRRPGNYARCWDAWQAQCGKKSSDDTSGASWSRVYRIL
jgi:hypothetical protein